jgi:hypothetical protein
LIEIWLNPSARASTIYAGSILLCRAENEGMLEVVAPYIDPSSEQPSDQIVI